MRVVVCGGRDYDDARQVAGVINDLKPGVTVVHGDARGADRLAAVIARRRGLSVEAHPADWQTHGRAAGPIRNQHMLSLGADLVVAFPGGKGTAHMVSIARKAGVPVLEVSP